MRVGAIYIFLFIAFSARALCQINTPGSTLKSVIAKIDSLNASATREKVFLHLDKQSYVTGDTLRFRGYLLDEGLFSSAKSGLLYVELISDSISTVKRQVIVLHSGVAQGDIIIKPGYPTGNYTIRSYTNWMRNYGEESFFTQRLSILSSTSSNKKVNAKHIPDKALTIDLQFMPEGGNLISRIPTKVAFKAIDQQGLGVTVSGAIYSEDKEEVATFRSTHKGMGSFYITPQAGKTYIAKITSNGIGESYLLPAVSTSGIVLKVDEPGKDSLRVILNASGDIANLHDNYFLIAESRGKICYAARTVIKQAQVYFDVAKNVFPTGLVKFILLNGNMKPVTQRLAFVDHNDALKINIEPHKQGYGLRDSINLQLQVSDNKGNPVEGLFSVAITDDSQAMPMAQDAQNIVNYMLLHPEITGNIEDPGYYFNTINSNRSEALDLLLLTQGWAGYDWRNLYGRPMPVSYQAEPEFKVTGRATNLFGFPVKNTEVELVSTRPLLMLNTRTDGNGRFTFSGFPALDTINFHIRPKRTFNIGVTIDDFVPPENTKASHVPPVFPNGDADALLANTLKIKKELQAGNTGAIAGKLLNEVNIRKGIVARPRPTVKVDEEQVRLARPGSKRFSVGDLLARYDIRAGKMELTVDGRAPSDPPSMLAWLYQHTVEDIKGVTATKMPDYLWINVTTNSGKGEVLAGLQGHAYHPMPISWPHKFYSPKYAVQTSNNKKDMRSTIYWNPSVVTDSTGKANVSFYSADIPGKYSVVLNGATLNGQVGFAMQTLSIDAGL